MSDKLRLLRVSSLDDFSDVQGGDLIAIKRQDNKLGGGGLYLGENYNNPDLYRVESLGSYSATNNFLTSMVYIFEKNAFFKVPTEPLFEPTDFAALSETNIQIFNEIETIKLCDYTIPYFIPSEDSHLALTVRFGPSITEDRDEYCADSYLLSVAYDLSYTYGLCFAEYNRLKIEGYKDAAFVVANIGTTNIQIVLISIYDDVVINDTYTLTSGTYYGLYGNGTLIPLESFYPSSIMFVDEQCDLDLTPQEIAACSYGQINLGTMLLNNYENTRVKTGQMLGADWNVSLANKPFDNVEWVTIEHVYSYSRLSDSYGFLMFNEDAETSKDVISVYHEIVDLFSHIDIESLQKTRNTIVPTITNQTTGNLLEHDLFLVYDDSIGAVFTNGTSEQSYLDGGIIHIWDGNDRWKTILNIDNDNIDGSYILTGSQPICLQVFDPTLLPSSISSALTNGDQLKISIQLPIRKQLQVNQNSYKAIMSLVTSVTDNIDINWNEV